MLNGVISGKLANLEIILAELESIRPLTIEALQANWQLRKAVERNIQLAVEIVLDVCHRLIALAGRAPTPTSRGAIEAAVQLGVLGSVEPFKQMVGMRSILVHRYEFVDPEKLKEVVNDHLEEFLSLQGRLQDALQRDEIDLVVLNSASPILGFEAINGELMVNKEPALMAGFVSVTCREYESAMQTLKSWPAVELH